MSKKTATNLPPNTNPIAPPDAVQQMRDWIDAAEKLAGKAPLVADSIDRAPDGGLLLRMRLRKAGE